jgi:signal transduction histidine kinase
MVLKVNLFLNPKAPNYAVGHVNDLISQTLRAMSRDFEAAAVVVNTQLNRDIPTQLIDGNKICQVLFNILQNALHAMPDGGAVTITSAVKGEFVEIRIEDTGPGIEEEDADSMFHAFFSGKQTGLGLGLTISSQIIHEHGGYINAEAGPGGRGAVFVVGLPLYPTGD